ncbi:MAG: hypothetical protein IPP99_20920 [Chitinophagaceae bacterium]|nr:hypothetical protein [Chitinophagaceae bacterium]
MKSHTQIFLTIAVALAAICCSTDSAAQQHYKLRQSTSMMGMKQESVIYVKPMRKRTENSGYMGQENNVVTIEQCDKQRMVTLNTKKKLYFLEPFANDNEEVIDEDAKPVTKPKTTPVTTKKGGIIYNYYNITDTGERKKMHGFTARHLWTTQKMKPSADACMMKDSMVIKTDGWYIDLPDFNCPIRYKPTQSQNGGYQKPDCMDRFVTRRSGKGKLGFPLIEKRTMIMGGQTSTSEFVTDLETIELITGKQDSMLFEIPPGYTLAASIDELQDKFDMSGMMKGVTEKYKNENNGITTDPGEKKAGVLRVGILEPKTDAQLQPPVLQEHMVGSFSASNVEAVAVSSAEDAKSKSCDLLLTTEILKMKQASKVGGLLKAIKNTDPNAAVSFNVEAKMVLTNLSDGSLRSEQNPGGKYEGKADDAAGKALDEGTRLLLKALK